MGETIARESQFFHYGNHIGTIEATVLVPLFSVELDGFGYAVWEIRLVSVAELQILTAVLRIGLGIIFFDKSTCATHQEEFHQFLPVVEFVATLKSLDATDEHLAMLLQEGAVAAQRADIFFWTDTQVIVLADEEFQLVGKVGEVFVIGCSSQ